MYMYDVLTCVCYDLRTIHTEGSAHDSARATAPDWRDGVGALLHLCRRAAKWPDARWVGHDEADAGLRVQRNARSPVFLFVFIRGLDLFLMIQQQQAAAVLPGTTECFCSTYTTSSACGDPAYCSMI